jgi:hypothetical protein
VRHAGALEKPTQEGGSVRRSLLDEAAGLLRQHPNQAYSTGGDFIALDTSAPLTQQDTLHHEVAHLWWSAGRPGTPDEFMSESVSEYLALRRGEQVWGAEWLSRRRAGVDRDSAAIEARIPDIDGFDGKRQPLMYQRGPAAL